ncbi:MAG: GbsR/MarR family transcriptional regulator [Pseudomonadota bacterium]
MQITDYQQAFILHFGEMGSRWGINRTVGQIYALLYVSPDPLNADDITQALGISRSNTSMGLKELQAWQLVQMQHFAGDRRDYFTAPEDVWQIFQTLLVERRKREVEPTLSMIRTALMQPQSDETNQYAERRMKEMLELIELTTGWLDDIQQLEQSTVIKLMKLGGGVQKLLSSTQKFRPQKKTG